MGHSYQENCLTGTEREKKKNFFMVVIIIYRTQEVCESSQYTENRAQIKRVVRQPGSAYTDHEMSTPSPRQRVTVQCNALLNS